MNKTNHNPSGLTREATFKAMVLFTTKMRDLGWPSLPGLLGGAQIIGGRPSDPGVEDDWAEIVAKLEIGEFSSDGNSLAPLAAYEAAFRFLAIQFRRRRLESVDDVVKRLSAGASNEEVREVTEDWRDALGDI